MDRTAALAEAYKRGLLPPDQAKAYEEAQRRGLVSGGSRVTAPAPAQATPAPKKPRSFLGYMADEVGEATVGAFRKGQADADEFKRYERENLKRGPTLNPVEMAKREVGSLKRFGAVALDAATMPLSPLAGVAEAVVVKPYAKAAHALFPGYKEEDARDAMRTGLMAVPAGRRPPLRTAVAPRPQSALSRAAPAQRSALADYARAEVDPMLAVEGGTGSQMASQHLAGNAFVGGALRKGAQRTTGQIKASTDRIADRFGGSATSFQTGAAIKAGVEEGVKQRKAAIGRQYDELAFLEEDPTPLPLSNSRAALDEAFAKFTTPELKAWMETKATDLKGIRDTIAKAPGASFAEMKAMRNVVGGMIDDPTLIASGQQAGLRKLYGALSEDLEAAAGSGIRAHHGSPHEFDKFDASKIGTGEGAQAYGRGLYFAENRGIAEAYKNNLSDGIVTLPDGARVPARGNPGLGDSLNDALRQAGIETALNPVMRNHGQATTLGEIIADAMGARSEWAKYTGTQLRFLSSNAAERFAGKLPPDEVAKIAGEFERAGEAFESLKSAGMTPAAGRTYDVRIRGGHDQFLDWDASVSSLPPDTASKLDRALARAGTSRKEIAEIIFSDGDVNRVTGERLYNKLADIVGSEREASRILNEAGISGIRYLDGGSRSAGSGTRNFVVFDDSRVQMLPEGAPADPAAALKAADTNWANLKQTQKTVLDRFFGENVTEQAAYQRMLDMAKTKGVKASWTQLRTLRQTIGREGWNEVASGVLRNMGTGGKGDEAFSVAKFATEWESLSPQARGVLFSGAGKETLKDLGALARVARRQSDASKFYNYSQSGNVGQTIGMTSAHTAAGIAAVTGNPAPLAALLALDSIGLAAAKLLSSPGFARIVLRARGARTPAAVAAVDRQLTVYARRYPALAPEVEQYRRALTATVPAAAGTARQETPQRQSIGAR